MSSRHKWGDKVVFPHKSETECIRCEVVCVSRHESENGRELHWKEFWRDCERIGCDAGRTPRRDARNEKSILPHVPLLAASS